MEALATISRMIRDDKFVSNLKAAKSTKGIRDVFVKADQFYGGAY